jgi:hypothetical protein
MARRLITTFLCLAATEALADPTPLSTADLNQTVAGAVIELDTPIGSKIPMRFGADGLVSGEAGILSTFLGAAKDRGRWWAANDKLCIKWFRWFSSEPRCMEIKVDGSRIFWRQDDGDTGTATLTSLAPHKERPAKPAPSLATPKPVSEPTSRATATVAAAPSAAPTPPAVSTAAVPARVAVPAVVPEKPSAVTAPITASKVAATPSFVPLRPRAPVQVPRLAAKPARNPGAIPLKSQIDMAGSFRVARVDEDDMLNVRKGPSEYHKAIGIISPRGRGVIITGNCVGEWCPIRHGLVTGWVNRYYLVEETKGPGAR